MEALIPANGKLLEKLDELIAATKAASIPFEEQWLDAEDVGAYLKFKPRYVSEKLACRPDFPKPMRIDGTGHPRWRAADIAQWAQSHC